MRYPQEFVDKVLEASNVVEIISQYTQLKPSGHGYMGRCPFPDHQEKTASFSVSESKQVYHCFGCKKSGNVYSFLRDYNGMNFVEALEYLADRYRIPIPESTDSSNDAQFVLNDKKKQIIKLNQMTADFYVDQLKSVWDKHPIRDYVEKRKLKPETIEEFKIGFAPAEWDSLTLYLQKNKVQMPLAEEAKLVKARKEGNGYFDLFRDRLMFPILSPRGEVVAFGGRIYDQGEPKYLNSPETLVFSKSRILYGLPHTAKYIRAEDSVVLVEGYMDAVSLFQAGLQNVAATMGTALTVDHAKLVKRMTSNVVVLFDGDDAGQMAAERSLSILLSQGLYPKGLILTDAKDPDEYINKFGLDAMKSKIEKSSDLFSVVLTSWMKDYRGEASQKVKLADRLKPIFDSIIDLRLKKLYLDEAAQKMHVASEWLRAALVSQNSGYNKSPAAPVSEVEPEPKKPTISKISLQKASITELSLIKSALKSRANFEFLRKICEEEFPNSEGSLDISYKQFLSQLIHLGVVQILEKAQEFYRQSPDRFDKFISLLIENVEQPELLFSKIEMDDSERERIEKYITDVFKKIQQNFLRQKSKEMALENKNTLDENKIQEIIELHKNRLSLKK